MEAFHRLVVLALLVFGGVPDGVDGAWDHRSSNDAIRHHHHHVVDPPGWRTGSSSSSSSSTTTTSTSTGVGGLLSRLTGGGGGRETESSAAECASEPPSVATSRGEGSETSPRSPDFCPGVGAERKGEDGAKLCRDSKPSRCKPGCETHGTCNQELKRCDCPKGRSGEACEEGEAVPLVDRTFEGSPAFCLNDCNDRGNCVWGFCHCVPGFFGSDCSLWLNADETPRLIDHEWEGRRPPPKVYVYNLPPEYNVYYDARRLDRNAELFFYERLLSSHHRTADAAEADLFLVPIPTRLTAQVYNRRGRVLRTAADYIARTWPEHVKRNDWRDHVFFFTGDWGPCEFYFNKDGSGRNFPEFIKKGIALTYWGLTGADKGFFGGGPCYFPEKDVLMPPVNTYHGREMSPFYPEAFAARMDSRSGPVAFDVKRRNPAVTPGPEQGGALVTSFDEATRTETIERGENPTRRWLLYFAGRTAGGTANGYAGRRRCKEVFAGREAEGIRFVERDQLHYEDNLAASTFCLAPTGDGWGRRTTLVALHGCIPVIVQDEVAQPFDDMLPYHRFSVRVAQKDLESLPETLRKIPASCEGLGLEEPCLSRMREQLACAVRSFLWSSVYGSAFGEGGGDDAFALTMLSLQHRVLCAITPGCVTIYSRRCPVSVESRGTLPTGYVRQTRGSRRVDTQAAPHRRVPDPQCPIVSTRGHSYLQVGGVSRKVTWTLVRHS